jgi:hypothetical protein
MAARKRTWTPEIVRRRIQTAMLLKRLHSSALGEIQMDPVQAANARFLFERMVPKAEAPKDLNIQGEIKVITGVPDR